jgi:transmembrane sensor
MSLPKERIKYLLHAWTSRKATPTEEKELFDWISENNAEGPVHAHIQKLVEAYQPGELMPAVDWENMYEKILGGRKQEEAPVLSRPSFPGLGVTSRRWIAAASIILLLGASVFVWFNNLSTRTQQLTLESPNLSNDALPGRQGAVLTLANGQNIVLDSLGNSVVTMQGKTKVLIRNGQLVYDATAAEGEMLYNTMTTPKGRQYKLVLPDGSKVWLNAASSLTYPTVFAGNERKVSIRGEAYFEVSKDKSKPFRVNIANQSEVEVLGTHFNINSYGDEGTIKTTLLEGSIKVSTNNAGSVVVKPGQQAQTALLLPGLPASLKGIAIHSDIDVEQVMAWKNGLFNFNHADLKTVMQQLARWYDMDVRYEGLVPFRQFKGEITRDLNLAQVLKLLEDVEVKFRIEGKTLIVTQ